MSPLVNEQFWRDRFGTVSPCWSGEKWLDWEHGVVMRHAFRRAWPFKGGISKSRGPRVLDVGCGDGRWTRWMAQTFDCDVLGTDALEFPGVRQNLETRFVRADAEALTSNSRVVAFRPDLVVFMNSLTCCAGWQTAVREAAALAPRVLAFDNFMTPTPPFLKNLPHRRPITQPALRSVFFSSRMELETAITADYFHRRLFLATPRWLHPAVALVSAGLDLAAGYVLPPLAARHVAFVFARGGR